MKIKPLLSSLLIGSLTTACQFDAPLDDATAKATIDPSNTPYPIYHYMGLKLAEGSASIDEQFQNFSHHNGYWRGTWYDSDAKHIKHKGTEHAQVTAYAVRDAEQHPYLHVEFNRQGHGNNISILPLEGIPEKLDGKAAEIQLKLRSSDEACVGIRIMEGDGEVWAFGKAPLDYQRFCVTMEDGWKTIKLPISAQSEQWFRFPYGGNIYLGSKAFEADVLAIMSIELGTKNPYYLGKGRASIDIGEIKVIRQAPKKVTQSKD